MQVLSRKFLQTLAANRAAKLTGCQTAAVTHAVRQRVSLWWAQQPTTAANRDAEGVPSLRVAPCTGGGVLEDERAEVRETDVFLFTSLRPRSGSMMAGWRWLPMAYRSCQGKPSRRPVLETLLTPLPPAQRVARPVPRRASTSALHQGDLRAQAGGHRYGRHR